MVKKYLFLKKSVQQNGFQRPIVYMNQEKLDFSPSNGLWLNISRKYG